MPAARLPGSAVFAAGLLLAVVLGSSRAAEVRAAEAVRVLAAGAVQGAVLQLEPDFMAAGGARLDMVFDTVGTLRDRVLAGAAADVVILSEAGIAVLKRAGKIAGGTAVELGSISVALAVRKGAPVPDVTSADTLKLVLQSARSIAHADPARGATAGTHFARVLEQLGIAAQIGARVTVLAFGGDVVDAVARGQFEIGVSQSSEIVAHPGVTLAGALPPPYAHRTRYVAAKPIGAGPGAEAALAFLQTPAARSVFHRYGFEANGR